MIARRSGRSNRPNRSDRQDRDGRQDRQDRNGRGDRTVAPGVGVMEARAVAGRGPSRI